MAVRAKLFLNFLGVCLAPLVLLALVNYWNALRVADTALEREQEADLTDFKQRVVRLLDEDENALTKLSRSTPLLDYLALKSLSNAGSQTTPTSPTRVLFSPDVAPNAVPVELRLTVASVLNSSTDFVSISVFDRKWLPMFVAEQRSSDDNEPAIFQTSDFLSTQPHPDDRVWSAQKATLLNSHVSLASFGARIDCTIPIFAAQPDASAPEGALVAELKLDPIFSRAANVDRGSPGGWPSDGPSTDGRAAAMFIVLDRGGQILYHTNGALTHRSVSASMPYFLPVANQMFSSELGRQSFTGPGGEAYSTTYTRIPTLDVAVAMASNRNLAIAPAHRAGRLGLMVAVLLGILSAVLLTLFLQRKSRGIARVSEGVEAIAKGKLDHRIELLSSDDLRPLADNVGLMTQQLREQIAREAESRQFQSFVRLSAILTHDLKNAIGALSLTVSNMDRHFENAEFRTDAMKTLRGATENLKSLVTRLSNPVTTLSGEHKRPQPVDLVPMLKRMISTNAAPASGEHEIKVSLPDSLYALVDAERMDKVIENLIINALEAMPEGKGTLSIEAGKTAEGKPFFSVSDTGQGMSRRFVEERLFHPFATTKKRGVGLGLYTCREVVRANGGSIEVNSREGIGTTFRVVLPSAEINKDGDKRAAQPISQ